MVLVCDISSYHENYFFQIPPCITKLWVGHEQVSLKSVHKVLVQTVTLTFDLATWFLSETQCLVMMIICAKLFQIPPCITKLWVGHEQV